MANSFRSLEILLFLDQQFRCMALHKCTYQAISQSYERRFGCNLGKSTFYEYLEIFKEMDAEFKGKEGKNGRFLFKTIQVDSNKRSQSVYSYVDPNATLPALCNLIGQQRKDSGQELLRILNEEKNHGRTDSLNIWMRLFLNKMLIEGQTNLNAVSFYENLDLMSEIVDTFEKILDAILAKKPIKFRYKYGEHPNIKMHPYRLKNYNQRWYVIGKRYNEHICDEFPDKYYKPYAIMSLNAIITDPQTHLSSVEIWDFPYLTPDEEDLDEYFYDTIGLTHTLEGPQDIYLRFNRLRYERYVATKPLAPSQILLKENSPYYNKDKSTIKLKVHINKELIQQILSFGQDCEVIAPQSLREKVISELKKTLVNYDEHVE